ncbi:MAG: hypothetical protein JWQ45_2616 [Blastococcus sp.]|jgi:hypothetical protein|nr:hypothetical protein [Blastococcus sp.]
MRHHGKHSSQTLASWLFVVLLAGTGCQAGTASSSAAAPESPQESRAMEPSSAHAGVTTVECGQQFQPSAAGALALTGRFPAQVPASQQTVGGTVEVSTPENLKGVTQPGADVFVVREGRVVAQPVTQDAVGMLWATAPGETKSVPGEVALTDCGSGEALPPGSYELYARVMIIPDDGGMVESFGGPWPLEIQ